eukprot:10792951-Lingulodinium_polyedra.AAC.1
MARPSGAATHELQGPRAAPGLQHVGPHPLGASKKRSPRRRFIPFSSPMPIPPPRRSRRSARC